jgi:hypothetical protein
MNTTSKKYLYGLLFCSVLFAVIPFSGKAQDTLFTKFNKPPIVCKVKAIEQQAVYYYKISSQADSNLYSIACSDVWKIIRENGSIIQLQKIKDIIPTDSNYINKFGIMFDPVIVLSKVLSVSFEYEFNEKNGFELGLAYIGLGTYEPSSFLTFDKVKGGFVRAGWKHKFSLNKRKSVFFQRYVRLDAVYLNHINTSNSLNEYFNADRQWVDFRFSGAALILNYGKQRQINKNWLIDAFVGLGMGYKTRETLYSAQLTQIDNYMFIEDSGGFGYLTTSMYFAKVAPVLQAGFKVGYFFNRSKN